MEFTSRTRYGLVFLAILTGSLIELARGYRLLVVAVGFLAFLFVGCLVVYLAGSKERANRRRQQRDYWAG
jgi:hypothetical protein